MEYIRLLGKLHIALGLFLLASLFFFFSADTALAGILLIVEGLVMPLLPENKISS